MSLASPAFPSTVAASACAVATSVAASPMAAMLSGLAGTLRAADAGLEALCRAAGLPVPAASAPNPHAFREMSFLERTLVRRLGVVGAALAFTWRRLIASQQHATGVVADARMQLASAAHGCDQYARLVDLTLPEAVRTSLEHHLLLALTRTQDRLHEVAHHPELRTGSVTGRGWFDGQHRQFLREFAAFVTAAGSRCDTGPRVA